MAEQLSRQPKAAILYYPTIDVPTDDWLRQALLYWDEVGSIVPEQWEADHHYRDDIRYLRDEGEYRAFRPEVFTQSSGHDEARKRFAKEFQLLWLSEIRRGPTDTEKSIIQRKRGEFKGAKMSHSVK